jgi:hypothetical protein
MEWLTRELTSIEKVRRNVILLAALACLLSIFPVETDQFSFLGARFTSEVVTFAVFHTLAFYTATLTVRSFIHSTIIDFEKNHFEHEIDKRLEDISAQQPRRTVEELKTAVEEMEATETAARNQRAIERGERDAAWLKMLEDLAARRRNLEEEIAEGIWPQLRAAQAREEISQCLLNEAKIREQVSLFRMQAAYEDARPKPSAKQRRLLAELERKAERHRTVLAQQGPFAGLVNFYVYVGEYLFPIAFGVLGAVLLLTTHDVAMVWELQLRTSS